MVNFSKEYELAQLLLVDTDVSYPSINDDLLVSFGEELEEDGPLVIKIRNRYLPVYANKQTPPYNLEIPEEEAKELPIEDYPQQEDVLIPKDQRQIGDLLWYQM